MKRLILLAVFCLALVSTPSLAEEAVKLEDENAQINYSVGYQVGGDFRRQGIQLDPEVVAKGIEDALSGNEPLMTPVEMRKELTDLQRRASAKQQARAEQAAEAQRQAGQAFLEANKVKEGVEVTASGLQYKVIREGSGNSPGPRDSVTVNYRGTLINGNEFDSSYGKGEPSTFKVNGVIKGWTEALQMMKEGAKWQLFIPPDLAYGERGTLADKTLIFDVELISVN
jgi:FKBP-type peptidyl-prolyl cis-trans isomerase FklB